MCSLVIFFLEPQNMHLRGVTEGFAMADTDQYSDAETERRANAALKRMLATPPKPHKDSKLGRRQTQPKR
jgi:hypothetical protein